VNHENFKICWFSPISQATKALRESRGIALALLCFQTLALLVEGGEGSASRPGRLLPPGKTRYPLFRRLGGLDWTGTENLAPTGIRSPDCPARSQSLYRLSYSFHKFKNIPILIQFDD
jgi:hypothetical protein